MQIARHDPDICKPGDRSAHALQVSVIIPVYNGGDKFVTCLDSIINCSPHPHEIIVVADGESDGSWRYALDKNIRSLVLENQGGPAHARNAGAQIAQGDILLFLDADVTVNPDIIDRVTDFFTQNSSYAAVIGSYDHRPTERDTVSLYKNLQHHFVHQHSLDEARTFWGACGAIRRTIFLEAGGFNRQYRTASIEDIEFGYRLINNGYRIKLLKDLQVTHQKKWRLFTMIYTEIFNRALPWSALLLKSSFLPDDLNLTCTARISFLTVVLLLISLLLWPFFFPAILLSIACCAVLLHLNRDFYRFLMRKQGALFLLRALPLHWLYFLYSGLSFALVFVLKKAPTPWSKIRMFSRY